MKAIYRPADPSNYSKGRFGFKIRKVTIHHMAGTPPTLATLYQNPNRNGSAHYGVFPDKIEQYVKEEDTAWTNSNWISNKRSITIENYGDWRGGYKNDYVLKNLEKLLKDIRKRHPSIEITYHQDVALKYTECPAQLRGYAQKIWDKITKPIKNKEKDMYKGKIWRKTRNLNARGWFGKAKYWYNKYTDKDKSYKKLKDQYDKREELRFKTEKELEKIKKSVKAKDKEIKKLQATQSEDTNNLNKLGEALMYLLTRLGFKNKGG